MRSRTTARADSAWQEVNIQQLRSTLKKELLRNKKKSGVLGVLFLVALYFWVPLIGGLFSGDDAEPSVETATAAPSAATPTPAATNTKKQTKSQLGWKERLEQRKQNPLMASATLDNLLRNPFSRTIQPKEKVIDPNAVYSKRPPESLLKNLQLTGTIIGRRQRWATINGKTYEQNEIVEIPAPDAAGSENKETGGFKFRIKSIAADSVELTRGGRTVKLDLPKGLVLGGD